MIGPSNNRLKQTARGRSGVESLRRARGSLAGASAGQGSKVSIATKSPVT